VNGVESLEPGKTRLVGHLRLRFFAATVLGSTAYGATFLLGKLLRQQGAGPDDLGSILLMTALFSVLASMAAGIVRGTRIRRGLLGIASAVLAFALLVLAGVETSVGHLCGGAMLGIGWGIFYSLTPVVLETTTSPEFRSRMYSGLAACVSAGFGLTPVLERWLSVRSVSVPDIFNLLAVGCILAGTLFLWDYRLDDPTPRTQCNEPRDEKWGYAGANFRLQVLIGLGAFTFSSINSFQLSYAAHHGFDYGVYFFVNTVFAIGGRMVHGIWLPRYRGPRTIALLNIVSMAAVATLLLNKHDAVLYAVAGALFGIGYGISNPLVLALIAERTPAAQRPAAVQMMGTVFLFCLFVAPFCLAPVIAAGGVTSILPILWVLTLIMTTVAASLSGIGGVAARASHRDANPKGM
jgi:MFS family permease